MHGRTTMPSRCILPAVDKAALSKRGWGEISDSGVVRSLVERLEEFYRIELGLTGRIALHEPWLKGNEWAYVKETLDTNWVSSAGPFVDRFESACAAVAGAARAVAVVNGTCALQIALSAVGVLPGDLVICPAISFVGTANAITHCGAEPLFMDVCDAEATLCPDRLAAFLEHECTGSGRGLRHTVSGRRVSAVVPVHIFGHPADMAAIVAVASARALTVVEDAAESVGSLYRGKPCGALGRIGILSFNGNKTVTAGGGGAIVTNEIEMAERIKHLTTTAKICNGFELEHDEVGYNYRLPNLNAALAYAQLESLPYFVRAKRTLAERYQVMLGSRFYAEPALATSNYWLSTVVLDSKVDRDLFLRETNARGIETRPCWRPLALLPMYREALRAAGGIESALDLSGRLVNLPSSPKMAAQLL